MQTLCKNCKNKNTCKEIDNYDKYCQDHIRLRKESALFDCEPVRCCLFERELFTDTYAVRRDGEQCEYIKKDIYDNLQSKYDSLLEMYEKLNDKYVLIENKYENLKNEIYLSKIIGLR